ncbi:MAG: ACP S-malonyltransferase, partial [Candidatus Omnitrophica bacterium]|nr:ACP S-malonyltransferase [Candidatus Omnitrophota bacterium]
MNKICFIFPGQGSQYVGMGKNLYDSLPESKNIFDQAEKNLSGLDLKKLCFEGPIEKLTETANSQVAILVTSIVALEALKIRYRAEGIEDTVRSCAGLSLGEYSALVASNALEFQDAVRLVRRRGELMEAAARNNPGTMASILGISAESLKEVCRETGAEIANLNSPGQIV